MPSRSIANRAGVNATLPCQTNRGRLHQSPDKRGVPLPVKMVSQLTVKSPHTDLCLSFLIFEPPRSQFRPDHTFPTTNLCFRAKARQTGAVLHQSPDKRGVPLPVKMVSQLTQTWHSQVRSLRWSSVRSEQIRPRCSFLHDLRLAFVSEPAHRSVPQFSDFRTATISVSARSHFSNDQFVLPRDCADCKCVPSSDAIPADLPESSGAALAIVSAYRQ